MESAVLALYASTYLHPGAGSTTGAIDLPVAREVHTHFPTIAGSSLKGALRQKAEQSELEKPAVNLLFGPETGQDVRQAGALLVGEARLLALPVRSLQSVFYWVTCPLILDRLARDLDQVDGSIQIPQLDPQPDQALVPTSHKSEQLVLEELDFRTVSSEQVDTLAQALRRLLPEAVGPHYLTKISRDLAVVPDDDFQHLSVTGTQMAARIVLDDKKTSKNLWYEETLPPETIFWSLIASRGADSSNSDAQPITLLRQVVESDGLLQVGGNETQGQGWCYTKLRGSTGR